MTNPLAACLTLNVCMSYLYPKAVTGVRTPPGTYIPFQVASYSHTVHARFKSHF